jgi:hypothetical protein
MSVRQTSDCYQVANPLQISHGSAYKIICDTINLFNFLVLSPSKEIKVSMALEKNSCKQNIRVLSINAMLTEWNLA